VVKATLQRLADTTEMVSKREIGDRVSSKGGEVKLPDYVGAADAETKCWGERSAQRPDIPS